jgi:hypothetical protein
VYVTSTMRDRIKSKLYKQIARTLLPGMSIPKPLELLFSWIESRGLFIDDDDGQRTGFLYPSDELSAGWTEKERPGGTLVEFFAEGNINLQYWFGHDERKVLNRLCVFAKTGDDGSNAAFWLDDDGNQKIVHLGSGSGSTLVCVLAEDPVDFLRLIAIGYDEICRDEEFSKPPNAYRLEDELIVLPNVDYQNWVRDTFSVTIPRVATEIVKFPARMGEDDSEDPFWKWVERNTQ